VTAPLHLENNLYRPRGLFDVLRLPVIGRVLRWRYGRLVFQLPLTLLAVLVMVDGFTGPQNAARNLATIAPWVHYRGLVVLALLLAGNLFCMGCPFTLTRTLAKRLAIRGPRFPRPLRSKWLAIGGLFFIFFLYEWLDLWSSPLLTAWVIAGYFIASFVLEAVFTESAFCKYVCPLGSFNFVYSTVSPTEITARSLDVCRTCVGHECINGSYKEQSVILIDQIATDGQPAKTHTDGPDGTLGCGTLLFVPQMETNLDCVLCLDCARACPHNNVALMARPPGAELTRADAWPKRWDVSLLVICLAFMALTNAFGMIPPVYDLLSRIKAAFGLPANSLGGEAVALLLVFGVGGLLLPVALAIAAGWLGRQLTNTAKKRSLRDTVAAFAPAFVPVGLGVWAAHYGFHFLTGALTIIPVFQEFLGGRGDWALVGVSDLTLINGLQSAAMIAGFLFSMVVAQRVAFRLYRRDAMAGLLPWALLFLFIMFAALWIFGQPMEMRGLTSGLG
jgi:polyferredoxin